MLLVPVEIKRYNFIGKCAKRIMIKSKFDIKVNKVGLKYHFISNASKLMVQTFWKYLVQFNKNWHRFNSLFAFRHVLHCDTSFPLNIQRNNIQPRNHHPSSPYCLFYYSTHIHPCNDSTYALNVLFVIWCSYTFRCKQWCVYI